VLYGDSPASMRQCGLRGQNDGKSHSGGESDSRTVLCERLEDAGGLGGQSRGLLGRDRLEPGTGMLFEMAASRQ